MRIQNGPGLRITSNYLILWTSECIQFFEFKNSIYIKKSLDPNGSSGFASEDFVGEISQTRTFAALEHDVTTMWPAFEAVNCIGET